MWMFSNIIYDMYFIAVVPNLLPLKEADSFQVDHQKDIPDEDSLTQSTCTVSANSSSGIVHMKKRIGLGGGVAMIVGTMIGEFFCTVDFSFGVILYGFMHDCVLNEIDREAPNCFQDVAFLSF